MIGTTLNKHIAFHVWLLKEMQVPRKSFRKALNNSDTIKARAVIITPVIEHLLCVPGALHVFFLRVCHYLN